MKSPQPWLRYVLIGVGVIVALLIALGVIGAFVDVAEPPAPTPAASGGASAPIVVREAGYYPPILNLELDAGDRREGTIFDDAGRAVLQLGDDAAAGRGYFARKVDAVNFTILGGALEGSSDRRIAHFTIPTAALRELRKSGASPRGALDAATEAGTWLLENDGAVDQFCLARSPFCEKLG